MLIFAPIQAMVKWVAIEIIEQIAQFFIINVMRIRSCKYRAKSARRGLVAWAAAVFRRFAQIDATPTPLCVRVPFPSYTAAPSKLVLGLVLFIRGLGGFGDVYGVRRGYE